MSTRLVSTLLFALIAAACGSDSSTASEETAEPTPALSAVEQGATSMAASSPIGEFMIADGGFDAALADYIVLVEEEIYLCMTALGFEFTRTDHRPDPNRDRARELTPREWTTEYGFGISTSVTSFDPRESSDANTPMLMRLGNSEREQWVLALTGGEFDIGPDGMDNRPLKDQGCVGQGFIKTGGRSAIEGLEAFGDAYEEKQTALFERREMVEVLDAWSRCMSEAGYPGFGALDDPETHIEDQLDQVRTAVFAELPEISDEQRRAWIAGEWEGDDPDFGASGLRELQSDEIALALADLDCYEAEVQSVYEPLRDEIEYGLIDEYATELNKLRSLDG